MTHKVPSQNTEIPPLSQENKSENPGCADFHSISSKTNGVNITLDPDKMTLTVGKGKRKMELKVKRNKHDRYGYEEEALSREVRRCRIVRKAYPEGWRYFVQLTLDGYRRYAV